MAVMLATLGFSGCADPGKVIDAQTGKPLSGVYVVARWSATTFMGVQAGHTCFNVDATQSDDRGEFTLSTWSGNFYPLWYNRTRTLWFYLKGYKGPTLGVSNNGTYIMRRDETSGLERLKYLDLNRVNTDCGSPQRQKEVLMPLYRAVYEEAKNIGKSPEELGYVSNALFSVEVLELGNDQALRGLTTRDREWGVKRVYPTFDEANRERETTRRLLEQ